MNIYQLELRSHYIEKSLEDENFKNTLFQAMSPRTDIFLIDEYFNPVSVINKGSHYLKVHIYKIDKDNSESVTNLRNRNANKMKIAYEKSDRQKLTEVEIVEMKFLNSYLDSHSKSRNIKKIRDKMSFLRYAIEFK